jgi:hypothetical protein
MEGGRHQVSAPSLNCSKKIVNFRSPLLIDLHCPVNLVHKPKARQEANCPGEEEKQRADDERVGKVQKERHSARNVQTREKIHGRVNEDIQRTKQTRFNK